jgi:HNH endonuclease
MIQPGDVISYVEMCQEEGASLQRGMNFRLRGDVGVVLMSLRPGAPYADQVEEGGKTLIYEGHDVPRTSECPDPKKADQAESSPTGTPTQNGLFWKAVLAYKTHSATAARFRVYEKIKLGIWAYAGVFELVDAWKERQGERQVFKFKLRICDRAPDQSHHVSSEIEHDRLIPTHVKIAAWKRDKGRCVLCGSKENLHFDHIVPFSKGGTSLLVQNIQLLCAKHNLQKRDKIQ